MRDSIITPPPPRPEVQLAIADFTMCRLARRLRAAQRLNVLLGVIAAAAVLWGLR